MGRGYVHMWYVCVEVCWRGIGMCVVTGVGVVCIGYVEVCAVMCVCACAHGLPEGVPVLCIEDLAQRFHQAHPP